MTYISYKGLLVGYLLKDKISLLKDKISRWEDKISLFKDKISRRKDIKMMAEGTNAIVVLLPSSFLGECIKAFQLNIVFLHNFTF